MSHWSSSLELSLILEQKQHGGLELVANSTLQCRLCHWIVSSVRPGAPRKVCTARIYAVFNSKLKGVVKMQVNLRFAMR
ncbi:hypothetical protein ACLKA7_001351 [Drosophila subpalustris]